MTKDEQIAALTAQVDAYRESHLHADNLRLKANSEAATLRDRLARISSAWPLVRDTDCSGGELASAIDEIDAALTDGGKHERS